MIIETKEPITIEVDFTPCGMAVITIDGLEYAQFQEMNEEELDTDKLRYWIEETYYDGCYKSSAYISCDLQPEGFTK